MKNPFRGWFRKRWFVMLPGSRNMMAVSVVEARTNLLKLEALYHSGPYESRIEALRIKLRNDSHSLFSRDIFHPATPEEEKVFKDFWEPILSYDGSMSLGQLKRELYDFHTLMGNVSKVYMEVTDGRISKPNTDPDVVIQEVSDAIERRIKDAFHHRDQVEKLAAMAIKDISPNRPSVRRIPRDGKARVTRAVKPTPSRRGKRA